MPQPTTSPAASPPSTSTPPAPSANVVRSDGVVGSNAPATGGQAGTLQPGGQVPAQQQSSGGGGMMLIMMLPIAALMIFMFLGNRKETKKRAELMANLQRNDKVQTIGGMIGNIAEINESEVVLRVDEITNTRVRVSRSAISAVLNRAGGAGGPSKPEAAKVGV